MTLRQVKNKIKAQWDFSKSVEQNVLVFNTKERQQRRALHRNLVGVFIILGLYLLGSHPLLGLGFIFIGAISFPGSAVTFDGSMAGGKGIAVCKLDASHFAVCYADSLSRPTGIIGSVSGTVITFGTAVEANTNGVGSFSLSGCALDSTHFVICYNNSFVGYAVVAATDGATTISSWGTRVQFTDGASNGQAEPAMAALDSTHFVIAYRNASTNVGWAVVASVSGTTPTFGTRNAFTSNTVDYSGVCAIDSTHFVVGFHDTAANLGKGVVGVVSGTTISSYGTIATFSGTNNPAAAPIGACALDSTHFALSYVDSTDASKGKVVVGSVATTTITFGTVSTSSAGTIASSSIAALSATTFVAFFGDLSSSGYRAYYCTVVGTTVTQDSNATAFSGTSSNNNCGICALNANNVVVGSGDGSRKGNAIVGQIPVPGGPESLGQTISQPMNYSFPQIVSV